MQRRYNRTVLSWSVVAGLLVPAYFLAMADVSRFAWDFRAYYVAAEAVLQGDPFVGISPGLPGVRYVYPPNSVVLFLPQAATGSWQTAFVVQTVINVLAVLGVATLVIRTIESRRGSIPILDRLLIVGFTLGSAPVIAIIGQGQIDTLLALAFAGAFLALERGRQEIAGIALASAALVKVFPVVLGLWLVWRRAWRALAAAIVTGITGLVLGGLWFGLDAYRQYLVVLSSRSRIAEFAGTVSPNFFAMSLYRPLSQLLPGVDPSLYAPLSLLILAPVVGLVAHRERTITDRLTTYLVAITAMVLVSPASNVLYVVYVYFPLLSLLYLGPTDRSRSLLLVGTAAIAFPIQPRHVATFFEIVDVPALASGPLLYVLRTALTVASIPLVGFGAILVGCVVHASRKRREHAVDSLLVQGD
jgi:hypothetical protein